MIWLRACISKRDKKIAARLRWLKKGTGKFEAARRMGN